MRRARSADLAMQPMRAQRRGPAYPTRLAVRARPALLARHVPNAWRRRGMRRLVEVALASGAAAGATGCILPFPGVVFTRASHYPEDEARQTIRDVMHRYGIEVVPGTKPIGTLRLRDDPNDPGPPYIPDLESTDGRWVFEYISADDVERCHTGFVEMHNSVLRTSARWGG